VEFEALEVGCPSCSTRGLRGEGRSCVCEIGLFELKGTGCGVFEGVEVGVERTCSWVGGAKALEYARQYFLTDMDLSKAYLCWRLS